MSILNVFENTGEVATLDPVETVTHRLTPPHLRQPAERISFGPVGGTSGELPVIVVDQDPADTARISIPVTYGAAAEPAEPPRPWGFRGTRRWTRSRALLFAATWPGGAR